MCLLLGGSLLGGLGPLEVRAQEAPRPDTSRTDTSQVDDARQEGPTRRARPLPASSDSLEAPALDRLALDGERSRTAGPTSPDTGRVQRYVPTSRHRTGELFESRSPFLGPRGRVPTDRSVTLDSTGTQYTLDDGLYVDGPMRLDASVYRREKERANRRENWTTLIEQSQRQRNQRGGVGINMTVPGGRESAFTTIFGKPQVDLRVNGQADINAGFQYSKNDRRARTGDATQIDPNFKQDLRLGITGTIGDKLRINVDWDTQSQFDYQNQVKLEYTGYEDEIIQSVKAGNVFLQTPTQLISGGQSLFGIKGTFQFGNLSLTTIASQQEGQSNSLSIEGGSETTEFTLQPTDYDEDAHFFLGYYFRNNWNPAHEDPTSITLSQGFDGVERIEVWKLTSTTNNQEAEVRNAAALVDLGEPPALLDEADEYADRLPPDPDVDQYDEDDLVNLRRTDSTNSVSGYVESGANLERPLGAQDFESGNFKKLEKGRDYRLDNNLGFLSLNQRLRPNEALAVAYRIRVNGEVREVGDFSGDQGGGSGTRGGDRLVLKLLRPTNPVAPGANAEEEPAAWFLEMRNVYRIRGRGFNADNFELDVEYNPSGQGATNTIPEIAGQQPLLQVLGLDRIDQSGARTPDNEFDFTAQTINPEEGLLYFPYLEPFGNRLFEAADNPSDADPFAFPNLYLTKKSTAERNTEKNVFEMTGSYKGQAKGFYDLKAFAGLVDGSVKVTSGGQTLQEGSDYVVDYQSGTVNITNESYLTDGRDIEISYEQQNIASLQQKTLLGARADWSLRDQYALGATVMRLSEKSPVDKFRIGEEPIQNTIWGVDGSMELEPRWLTQAVDALPLIQTRAESRISVSGEFAQLRPGQNTTEAFERTVQEVEDSDTDSFAPDERSGVSYVDDFEGFENTFSLRQQLRAWQVSAAPDSIAPLPDLSGDTPGNDDERARTHWRGSFGWYQINRGIDEFFDQKFGGERGAATRLLNVQEVFPDRDTRGSNNPILRTLDFYFDPWERGPYNYTTDLDAFFRNPTRVWGGVTRQLPEGYTDFSVQNVEFVEFIVKVFPENGQVTDGAKLYVDLGTISEDVLPDERLNGEDGLRLDFASDDLDVLSRLARGNQDDAIDVQGGKTEDLGLDGLVSYTGGDGPYASGMRERTFYNDFVGSADSLLGEVGQLGLNDAQRERLRAEIARIKEDPSADDYHHYENDRYYDDADLFADEPAPQQRLSRYYAGYELNGFESQNQLAEDVSLRQGLASIPDTEDLDRTGGSVNITDRYFQYAIPLDSLAERAETDAGATDYVVGEAGRENSNWYKVRIPVREFTDKVGNIDNFTNIQSIRMWTTGHAAPVTMRFAELEMVGSQWRASDPVAQQPVNDDVLMNQDSTTTLRVASINNEENPDYEPPAGAIVSRQRTAQGVQQQNREQALLLNANKLEPGQQRGIFKTFQQGLDLLKYSNLRMYTHVHGRSNDPQEKQKIRENLRLFVRLGGNETEDYYEYEQPLKPSDVPGSEGATPLWYEDFEMNILLSAFSQLKTARSELGGRLDTTFSTEGDQIDLPLDFAPPDTEVKIRGTPSLNQINTVVIGVRHDKNPDENPGAPVLRNLEVWVNELRVSGFDDEGGWATTTSANVSLADFADVQGNFQRKTDGFGSLSSTLDERRQADDLSWSVRSDVNLDALLPERQGWSMPVTMQVQSSLTEPRFDPQRGDVRISEIQSLFDDLDEEELRQQVDDSGQSPDQIRETLKDSVRRASQTHNLRRTVTASLSKSNSESWWMRKTVDATSLNFSYLNKTGRSPQRSIDDRWSWSSSFDYQLNFDRSRTVRPLGFLPDAPVLGALGDVEFNYVPTSLSFSASADRQVSTQRSRPATRRDDARPPRISSPFRENQNFTHRRNFSLQYDPFSVVSLGFDTNTQQTLSDVAGRTQRNLIFTAESGLRTFADVDTTSFPDNLPPSDREELEQALGSDLQGALGDSLFVEERLRRKSEGQVFRDLFFGDASPRTNSYRQRFSATFRIGKLTDRQALDWIDLQDFSYQASFNWNNGAKGSLSGASVDNSVTLRTGTTLHPNKVWERFGFYERMKQAQREDDQDEASSSRGGAPSDEEADGDAEEGEDDEEEDGDDEPLITDVSLPDPVGILRSLALTFMDVRDFSINYTENRSSRVTNVGDTKQNEEGTVTGVNTSYSLLDALRDDGPSLGYRLGLSRSIDTTKRVFEQGQVRTSRSDEHQIDARTSLTPNSSLNIDLNWEVSWSTQPTIDFRQRAVQNDGPRVDPDGVETMIERFRTESGGGSASVWAFGSYQSMVEAQLEKLRRAGDAADTLRAGDAPLTTTSTVADFRGGYLFGSATIAGRGFVPFPLPGWTVRYSGLSDWPLIKRVTENVSINHSYSATYQTGFSSNSTAGETETVPVGNTSFGYEEADFQPDEARISEQYQPLVGLDVTWPWDFETSVSWTRRIETKLLGSNVVERKTSELSGSFSYRKRGMRLPFLPRIDNQIRLSVSFTRSSSDEREFLLNEALSQAQGNLGSFSPGQALEGSNADVLTQQTRTTISPQISYTVSNRVTADFRLEFEKLDVQTGRQTSFTNVNGTFNLNVSLSQN